MFKKDDKVEFRQQWNYEVGEGGWFTAARFQSARVTKVDDEYVHLVVDDPGMFLIRYNGGHVSVPLSEASVLGPYMRVETVKIIYTLDPVSNVLMVHALPELHAPVRTTEMREWSGDVPKLVRRAAEALCADLDTNLTKYIVWDSAEGSWFELNDWA